MATNPAINVPPESVGPDAPPPGEPAAGRLRFRRRRSDHHGDGADQAADLLAELVLLREENARLKAGRHQLPSLGRLVGQARSLGQPAGAEDAADEAAEMLVEAVVLRDSLLEVCGELERSMAAVRARLERLGAARIGLAPVPEEADGA